MHVRVNTGDKSITHLKSSLLQTWNHIRWFIQPANFMSVWNVVKSLPTNQLSSTWNKFTILECQHQHVTYKSTNTKNVIREQQRVLFAATPHSLLKQCVWNLSLLWVSIFCNYKCSMNLLPCHSFVHWLPRIWDLGCAIVTVVFLNGVIQAVVIPPCCKRLCLSELADFHPAFESILIILIRTETELKLH